MTGFMEFPFVEVLEIGLPGRSQCAVIGPPTHFVLRRGSLRHSLTKVAKAGGWCRSCTHAAVQAHSVFGTGALLLCQPSEMVRVAGLAPASSSFRTRPSAA